MRWLCVLLLVAGIQQSVPDPPRMLMKEFEALPGAQRKPVRLGKESADARTRPLVDHGITEISIETWPAFELASMNSFTLRADGTVLDHRRSTAGRLPPREFAELARLVLLLGYGDLHNAYDVGATDQGEVYTSIVRNGARTIIRNRGRGGPVELSVVEQLIEGAAARARWP